MASKDLPMTVAAAVHELQLSLLEGIKNQNQLVAAGCLMSRADYMDVVTERTLADLCGYPLCGKSLPPPPPPQKGMSNRMNNFYDQIDPDSKFRRFCSSSCMTNSRAFARTLEEERNLLMNPTKLIEILTAFRNSTSNNSIANYQGDFGFSKLTIQENLQPKGGDVSLDDWMGPSNAIEGYIPRTDTKSKALTSKDHKDGSNAKSTKAADIMGFLTKEMNFPSTVICSDEYSISKEPSTSTENQKRGSGRKAKKSKGKIKFDTSKEHPGLEVSLDQRQHASSSAVSSEVDGLTENALRPALKSTLSKKLNRSVTWADEKSENNGSLCEVREIENSKVGFEEFGASNLWSADACYTALSHAAKVVASGESDISSALSEAGIRILPHPHEKESTDSAGEHTEHRHESVSTGEELVEPEPPSLKWPDNQVSELFDTEDSWFDAKPEGFSLELSTFATMWNTLFGWMSSSSLAYIYGKDDSLHEDYLLVNGMSYPRKMVLADGLSSEIKQALAGCLARALPGLAVAIGLPISISDVERGVWCLLNTMSFTEALPPFRMKQWQVLLLLFIDALSVCRIPALTPYMTKGRTLFSKVLEGGQISMVEYETMKDLLLPLGRSPELRSP